LQDTQKNVYKKLLGKRGEVTAAKFLKKSGYIVVCENYRSLSGEADLIAYDKNALVFIEVKTRSNENFGLPCEAVGHEKQSRYIKIAKEYIYKNRLEEVDVRFDIIEILNDKINHIKNAFQN
jgi:putative endonuclease